MKLEDLLADVKNNVKSVNESMGLSAEQAAEIERLTVMFAEQLFQPLQAVVDAVAEHRDEVLAAASRHAIVTSGSKG
jgi:hypothetical protein